MEHFAPLIQTILWVSLIGIVLYRFHDPIYGLLVALQKRVEAGSSIKAGPFEINDQLKPQDPIIQKEKAALEVQEVLQAEGQEVLQAEGQLPPEVTLLNERMASVKARYFQAEDLVLRAIQAEYGAPLHRQVTAGRDTGFDGLFIAEGRTNVVEVKYISTKARYPRLKPTIERLTKSIQSYGWMNAQIILVLVFDREEDIKNVREILSVGFSQNPVPVVVRIYSLGELKVKFGVDEKNGD
ncbi:hypothetical protein SAMN05216315_12637 [Nitrosospira sp. Nsp18]|uniref:hypothetical protein n=1 Tax=Nitrosospira sp. Nsp18 TaxID=1855334 RepID=UPI000881039D|nr:hypothetical protein [Nitrosospira sp. Nsp18]SDA25098.1 hypothetical protein SAMN05216315_12637 [Nitrosospira sp. Nsp18]